MNQTKKWLDETIKPGERYTFQHGWKGRGRTGHIISADKDESGATSATNAGTHTVYFTPKAGYTWADESVESKTVTWSIAKAVGTLSLSATSGTINGNGVT